VGAEAVGGEAGALDELERLRIERDRRGDRVQLVAAARESVQDLAAIHVRERRRLGDAPGPVEKLDRLANLAEVHARPGLRKQGTELELRGGDGAERRRDLGERGNDVVMLIRLDRRLGPRDDALDALALARGDSDLEERRVDPEAVGQPFDGLGRRTRLPALDLADVLLGEAFPGELGLRQPAGDAELAHALAESGARGGGGPCGCGVGRHCS
jgi:hypothetical protein